MLQIGKIVQLDSKLNKLWKHFVKVFTAFFQLRSNSAINCIFDHEVEKIFVTDPEPSYYDNLGLETPN